MPYSALPDPMLARAEPTLPVGDYAYEVKWDGFRAVVSTEAGFRVRSRRGWRMEALIPELARQDVCGVFERFHAWFGPMNTKLLPDVSTFRRPEHSSRELWE
jgi:hypothetical protein